MKNGIRDGVRGRGKGQRGGGRLLERGRSADLAADLHHERMRDGAVRAPANAPTRESADLKPLPGY